MEKRIYAQARKNIKLILRTALENPAIGDAISAKVKGNPLEVWSIVLVTVELVKPTASRDFLSEMSDSLARMIEICQKFASLRKEHSKEYTRIKSEFSKQILDVYANSVAIQFVIEYSTHQSSGRRWTPSANNCWNALAQLASAEKALGAAIFDLSYCYATNPITIFGGSSAAAQRCSWEQTAVAAASNSVDVAKTQVSNMCGGWLGSFIP